MTDVPIISRDILARHFGDDKRMISAFEDMNAGAAEAQAATTANVAATSTIQDATVIVLSANEAFTNERILRLADGLEMFIDDTYATIRVSGVALAENFGVTLVAAGDSTLFVPLSGNLVAFENAGARLGNYADDAAAAAAGVLINQLYHNAGAIRVRLV
jgi:hypothetical protein